MAGDASHFIGVVENWVCVLDLLERGASKVAFDLVADRGNYLLDDLQVVHGITYLGRRGFDHCVPVDRVIVSMSIERVDGILCPIIDDAAGQRAGHRFLRMMLRWP